MNFKAENRLTTSTGQRKGSRVRKYFNVFANHHPKVFDKSSDSNRERAQLSCS